jgi:RNA polymerase sigma-70 factor (ECF subfamily)
MRLYTNPDRREYLEVEARSVVEKALLVLSPKLRAAVVLHYYEGFTREEVAGVLGIPPGTVASRIAKAMLLMRRTVEENDHLGGPQRSSDEGVLRTG